MTDRTVVCGGNWKTVNLRTPPLAPADLRDHFAAAALTGVCCKLMAPHDNVYYPAEFAKHAYVIADAMVAERAKTTHDAVPAARAYASGDSAPGSEAATDTHAAVGTGNTPEPVAWAVVYPNNEVAVIAFKRKDADDMASASDSIVPLYAAPQDRVVRIRLPLIPSDLEISEANGYAMAMDDIYGALTEAGLKWEVE